MTKKKSTTGKFALGAALGAAVGVVTGFLTAPKSGKETRADIKKGADKAAKKAEKKVCEVKKSAKDFMQKAQEDIDETVNDKE